MLYFKLGVRFITDVILYDGKFSVIYVTCRNCITLLTPSVFPAQDAETFDTFHKKCHIIAVQRINVA